MIAFSEQGHRYFGIADYNKDVKWTSATDFVEAFSHPFDKLGTATKVCLKKGSKWYGIAPNEIVRIWDAEAKRSTDMGTLYHNHMEAQYLSKPTMTLFGKELPVYAPMYNTRGEKVSFNQLLYDGAFPEYLFYHQVREKRGLCGQSDFVAFVTNKAYISDHKTVKELKRENPWAKMKYPFDDMDDCNWNHYVVQLNLYMWIALRNNPGAVPGEMVLRHVEFELDGVDKWGFPLVRIQNNLPVVKRVTKHPVPYLGDQMDAGVLEWLGNVI
jgi:hypothetical protein